jgi:hypothetical protein
MLRPRVKVEQGPMQGCAPMKSGVRFGVLESIPTFLRATVAPRGVPGVPAAEGVLGKKSGWSEPGAWGARTCDRGVRDVVASCICASLSDEGYRSGEDMLAEPSRS